MGNNKDISFEEFEMKILKMLEAWKLSKRPNHRKIRKFLIELNNEFGEDVKQENLNE